MSLSLNLSVFEQFPTLQTRRLLLRQFDKTDAKFLFEIRSDDKVMQFMDTTRHNSLEDAEKLIEKITEDFKNKTGINWVIVGKEHRQFIGYICIWKIDSGNCRGEIGYALRTGFWGQGYMREALRAIIHFGFDELNLHSFEANVNPANQHSIKLLDKLGFVKEGHFRENYFFNGHFIDSVIYSLLERDINQP